MSLSNGSYVIPDESVLSKKVFDCLIDYKWQMFCVTPLKHFDENKYTEYTRVFEDKLEKKYLGGNFIIKFDNTYTNNELTAVEIDIKSLRNEKLDAKIVLLTIPDSSNKYNICVKKFDLDSFCKNLPIMFTKGSIPCLEVIFESIRKLFSVCIVSLTLSNMHMKQIINRFMLWDGKANCLTLDFASSEIKDFTFSIEFPIEEIKLIFTKIQKSNDHLDLDEKSSRFYRYINDFVTLNSGFVIDKLFLESFSLPCLKMHSVQEFSVHDSKTAYDFCEFLYKYVLIRYTCDI